MSEVDAYRYMRELDVTLLVEHPGGRSERCLVDLDLLTTWPEVGAKLSANLDKMSRCMFQDRPYDGVVVDPGDLDE